MAPPAWAFSDLVHRGYWWRNRSIVLLNICIILPLLSATMNGLDSSLVNGLQILPSWQSFFDFPKGIALGLINSAQNIGAVTALPLTPLVSDNFGRRATLFLGALIMLAGVVMQWAAASVPVFIGARVVIGFGLSLSVNSAPLLITELAYPTQRGKITSLYNTVWYTGSITSAWACFGAYNYVGSSMWSWKIPTLVQGVAPLLQLCLIWFIPESPRYLVSKGLESQATKILARFHTINNDERDPLVVFEMAQIRHALKLERDATEGVSMWKMWTTPGNLKRLRIIVAIAMFSQWSGNGLVSYYINLVLEGVGITSTRTKAAINGGLQVFNLMSAMTGAFLVDWMGRRPLFIISNVGMLIAFCSWTLTTALFSVDQNTAAAKATVPLIFLYYFLYDIAYTPLIVSYSLEILPYGLRAKGFAIMNMTISLTQAFNQFVNPWALNAIGWKYYLVYCGLLVLELLFVLRYIVETKGRTLEETAALFDGEIPEQELVQLGGQAATLTFNLSKGGITPDRRLQKSTDYGRDMYLSVRSYGLTTGSHYNSDTDSRRQSQESEIAIVI